MFTFLRSRKCLDSNGRQLVFAVKKGSDSTVLWKGTVRVACVKIDPATRKIDNFKLLNLKQFLQVFKTFEQHLQAMDISEVKQQQMSASVLFEHFDDYCGDAAENSSSNNSSAAASPAKRLEAIEQFQECSICMDRQPEVLLPCAHLFCCPCIEQWNMTNKTCPICSEELTSTKETWILEDMPKAEEVSEEICTSLMGLSIVKEPISSVAPP
jgi:Zinc finger, C3HC4 type (RING finger)